MDATLGDGGHAAAICNFLSEGDGGRLIGLDRDEEALIRARNNLEGYKGCWELVKADFSEIKTVLKLRGYEQVDGIIMDLGLSSYQVDTPERGFSYQYDGPLDMRMDLDLPETAATILNERDASELARIFKEYGEERWASKIASFIVDFRKRKEIETTGQLVDIIKSAVPAGRRQKGGHPARRCFQALRIEVNKELEQLQKALMDSAEVLKEGGRLCVISYHSLEDRKVKKFFQWEANKCICPPGLPQCACEKKDRLKVLTKKPVKPKEWEINDNPRSRSAVMRVAQRTRL